MAGRNTYLYKISMGKNGQIKEIAFAYGRNKKAVIKGYQEIFKEKKYDKFDAVMFGEADIKRHPEYFMPMPKEEVEYIMQQELAKAQAYAQRKLPFPLIREGDHA